MQFLLHFDAAYLQVFVFSSPILMAILQMRVTPAKWLLASSLSAFSSLTCSVRQPLEIHVSGKVV